MENTIYTCDVQGCTRFYDNAQALRTHRSRDHKEEVSAGKLTRQEKANIACPYCEAKYGRNADMFEHVRKKRATNDEQHQEREDIVDPLPKKEVVDKPKKKCPHCEKGFDSKSNLNRHLKNGCPKQVAVLAAAANTIPQFGIERPALQVEQQQQQVAAVGPLVGQQERIDHDPSLKEIEEEKKEESLADQCANQLMETHPSGSDGQMQSLEHHQDVLINNRTIASSLPDGIEIPKAGQPLIGSNQIQNSFNNAQQDFQGSQNFDIISEVLLNNNNKNNNASSVCSPPLNTAAGSSSQVPGYLTHEEQIAMLKAGKLNTIHAFPQSCVWYDDDAEEEKLSDEAWVSRDEHEHSLNQECFADKINFATLPPLASGSASPGSQSHSSKGKSRGFKSTKPLKRKIITEQRATQQEQHQEEVDELLAAPTSVLADVDGQIINNVQLVPPQSPVVSALDQHMQEEISPVHQHAPIQSLLSFMRSEVSSASVPQVSSPQAFDEIIIEEGKAAPIFELNLSIDIEMVKEEVAPFDNAEVSQIEEEKSEDSISINDTSTKVATVAKKAPRKKKQAKKTKKKAAAAAKNNTKRNQPETSSNSHDLEQLSQPSSIPISSSPQVEAPQVVQRLYRRLQKFSTYQWSVQEQTSKSEVGPSQSTRSWCSIQKTSQQRKAMELFENSDASAGYGEITHHSMQQIIQLLQNTHPTQHLRFDTAISASPSETTSQSQRPEEYYLTQESSFLDIGSGFGMAVWHVYAVALCLSMGQEIVPHRHNFATDSHQLLQESDDAELVSLATEALQSGRVQFYQEDAAAGSGDPTGREPALPYVTDSHHLQQQEEHVSHIFSFNLVFSQVDLLNIAERLNTTNFRVLVWSRNPHQTMATLGVRDIVHIGTFSVHYNGGTANFYFYAKVPSQQPSVVPHQHVPQSLPPVSIPIQEQPQQQQKKRSWEETAQCSTCSAIVYLGELSRHEASHGETPMHQDEEIKQERHVPISQQQLQMDQRVSQALRERATRFSEQDRLKLQQQQQGVSLQRLSNNNSNNNNDVDREEEKESYADRIVRERAAKEKQMEEQERGRLSKLQCPVCQRSGFASDAELQEHASSHFSEANGPASHHRPSQHLQQEDENAFVECEICLLNVPFSAYLSHTQNHQDEAKRQRDQQVQQEVGQFRQLNTTLTNQQQRQQSIQRQQQEEAAHPPLLQSWHERNAFSNMPFLQVQGSQGYRRHMNPPRYPSGQEPGKFSMTQLKGNSLPNQRDKPRHHGKSLYDTLNQQYNFSDMTTKRITKEEIKKNNGREFNRPLNRSDLRFFPVAVITADEAKEQLPENDPERLLCFICCASYKTGEDVLVLRCSHHAHQQCLNEWLLNNSYNCPYCKHPQMEQHILDQTLEERKSKKKEGDGKKLTKAEEKAERKKKEEEDKKKKK